MHGCKYEDIAIKAYAEMMSTKHVNFKVEKCGLFINSQHPFLDLASDRFMLCQIQSNINQSAIVGSKLKVQLSFVFTLQVI